MGEIKEEERMRNIYKVALAVLLLSSTAFARSDKDQKKQEERLQKAGEVMSEILAMPESIPQNLLAKSKCVVVMPSVKKAAFVIGGSYGRGAMVCRTGNDFVGPWGPPTMIALEGGSVGLQLGAESADLVFLIMNGKGASSLLHNKVKIGADISAAAGPVGRAAEADTDVTLKSELLTYSRARGLFAGISLEGSTLRPDNEANEALYGRKVDADQLVVSTTTPTPEAARKLVTTLERASSTRKTS
jgi:SH3 domain-containing YSC84-like protein 1